MKLSIAIPAYNRPEELGEALDSIAIQCESDVEIVVSEDYSPQREKIQQIISIFREKYPSIRLEFFQNEINLGYDANLRSLLDKATGDYVLFMGDDDRVLPGTVEKIKNAISQDNIGVVLRAWRSYDSETGAILDSHNYFSGDRFFPAGLSAVAAFYRRSVFISGLTVNRRKSQEFHTDKFDGLLLYQLYLVGSLLVEANGYYVDHMCVERRAGAEHFFGTSRVEKNLFQPGQLDRSHSVNFLRGLFDIARHLDVRNPGVFSLIRKDLGRYSYPMLEIQARKLSRLQFVGYCFDLARVGLGRSFLFWIYAAGLLVAGPRLCNAFIASIVTRKGSVPILAGTSGRRMD